MNMLLTVDSADLRLSVDRGDLNCVGDIFLCVIGCEFFSQSVSHTQSELFLRSRCSLGGWAT